MDLDYPILSDPSKSVAKAFGVLGSSGRAMRHTVYVDKDGKIAYIDRKVKAGQDGGNVAARLDELKFKRKAKKDALQVPDKDS